MVDIPLLRGAVAIAKFVYGKTDRALFGAQHQEAPTESANQPSPSKLSACRRLHVDCQFPM